MLLAVLSSVLLISTAGAQLFDNNLEDSIEHGGWAQTRRPLAPSSISISSDSDFANFPGDCAYDASQTPVQLPQFATEFEFMQRRLKWAAVPQDLSTPATRKYYAAVMFSSTKKRGVFVYEDDLNHAQQRYRSIDVYNASQAFDVDTVTGTCIGINIPTSVSCSPYAYYITKEAGYRTEWADDACHYSATPLIPVSTDSLDVFAPPATKFYSPYARAFKQCIRVQHGSNSTPSYWLNHYYYTYEQSAVATDEHTAAFPLKVVITNLNPEIRNAVDSGNLPMAKQVYDFLVYRPYIKRYQDFEPPSGVCCLAPNVTLCNGAVPVTAADATPDIPTVAVITDSMDDSEYLFVQEYPILTMLVAVLALPTLALLFGLLVIAYRKKRLEHLRQRQRVWMVAHIMGSEKKV